MENSRPPEPSLLATRRSSGSRTRSAVIACDELLVAPPPRPPPPPAPEARALQNTSPSAVARPVRLDNTPLPYGSVPMPKFFRDLDSVSEHDAMNDVVRHESRRSSGPSASMSDAAFATNRSLRGSGRRSSAPENFTRLRNSVHTPTVPLVLDGMPTPVEPFMRSQDFNNLDLTSNSGHSGLRRTSSHSSSNNNNNQRMIQSRKSEEEEQLRHAMEISRSSHHSVSQRSRQEEEDEELTRVLNLSLQETNLVRDESISDFESALELSKREYEEQTRREQRLAEDNEESFAREDSDPDFESILELSKREFEEQTKRELSLEQKEKRSIELALRRSQRDSITS